MDDEISFDSLLMRLHAGDELAAEAIFNQFSQRLVRTAQRRLAPSIRQKIDAEDVIQSVFRSFFARHGRGQYTLTSWDSLWSLLVVMTLHKCGHQVDRFLASCRAVDREVSSQDSDGNAAWEGIAREPTPSEALALNETVEELLSTMSQREQQILVLKLQGDSTAEISAAVGRSERTVERVLEQVRARLLQNAKTRC
jgi:RNA polymerase sigma-70 factor (ECF subfamily)